jgi:hypothetical protein
MRGGARLVQVQVHHETAREHPPRQVGTREVEHDVPSDLLGAEELGDLDLDHDVDEDGEGKEATSPSSAFTVDTTRPSTAPPSTAWSSKSAATASRGATISSSTLRSPVKLYTNYRRHDP